MGQPAEIVRQAYEAFSKGDVQAILDVTDPNVDWEFVGSPGLAYAGKRSNHAEVGKFFADVAGADDIHAFEPREFIESGDHVTVLGWEDSTARDTGKQFQSEWIHLFTVKNGKITRWRGFFNTASRYGM